MRELEEIAAIRRLPDGQTRSARIRRWESGQIVVAFSDERGSHEFVAGAPVEVNSGSVFYLGEVIRVEESGEAAVRVEHFVERAALDEIGKAWAASEWSVARKS